MLITLLASKQWHYWGQLAGRFQPTTCLIATLYLIALAGQTLAFAPQSVPTSGVSSNEFLELYLGDTQLAESPPPNFPFRLDSQNNSPIQPIPDAAKASYEPNRPTIQAPNEQSVQQAQYESPYAVATPVGSGVSLPSPSYQAVPFPYSENLPSQTNSKPVHWHERLRLTPNQPDFLVGYEAVSLRRSSDTIGPYSQGSSLDRPESDLAGRYTFSRLLGNMEQIEFKFTGPFQWGRHSSSAGSVDSNLPLSFSAPFNNADRHNQSHNARLASYELNRCFTGDEVSKFFHGLRIVDYEEQFRLDATQGTTTSEFQFKTDNLLVGWQLGLHLNRPLSQRLLVGLGAIGGLYGNFTRGSMNIQSATSTIATQKERNLRLSAMGELMAIANYRITQNIFASGGYEFWYIPALATAASQRLDYVAPSPAFSLKNGDDQLFRGWTVGISARF